MQHKINGCQQVSPADMVALFRQCESVDSCVLFDPRSAVWYVGMAAPAEMDIAPSEDIDGFFADSFFQRDLDVDPVWRGFKRGKITYPYYYVIQTDVAALAAMGQTAPSESMKTFMKEPYEIWQDIFNAIQNGIAAGTLEKVVASRRVQVTLEAPVHTAQVLLNLLAQQIASYVFCYRCGDKAFMGATPEILIDKTRDQVLSYALAGTVKRAAGMKDIELDELATAFLQDVKNTREHQIVVEAIRRAMESVTSSVTVGPMHVLTLSHMLHLKTDIVATDASLTAIDWVQRLHPTPAMGGSPREASLALLAAKEPYERGLFASPIGVLMKNGDALVVVGIRSAVVTGKEAYAFAGCGIVAASDCQSEYDEIDTKLRTIVEAL